jgi:alpha-glucosidase
MTGGRLRRKDMKDPLSYRTYPLKRFCRDMARTPMQWDSSANSGFSGVKPWLPVDSNFKSNNVSVQEADPDSLLNFYKKLIWLRKQSVPMQSGDIKFYQEYLPGVLVFQREAVNQTSNQKLIILLNFTESRVNINLSSHIRNDLKVLLGTHRSDEQICISDGLELNKYEVLIGLC